MKKLSSILLGWWFWITNRNSLTARKRLKICASCEFRKWFVCGECFCPLQAKARSDDDCPKGKWPKLSVSGPHTKYHQSYDQTVKELDANIKADIDRRYPKIK